MAWQRSTDLRRGTRRPERSTLERAAEERAVERCRTDRFAGMRGHDRLRGHTMTLSPPHEEGMHRPGILGANLMAGVPECPPANGTLWFGTWLVRTRFSSGHM